MRPVKGFPVFYVTAGDKAYVPWALVLEHEAQCLANHRQDVVRLADRGGLSPEELAAVLEDRPWRAMEPNEAWRIIVNAVFAYHVKSPSGRDWICQRCNYVAHASYDDLAVAGIPRCSHCDELMEQR
ncbi:MAG: hypothetical protein WC992_03045 [Acholeplasmataceae bacterium]